MPNLKMQKSDGRCAFLREDNLCNIHTIRPGICRMFPLGRYWEDETDGKKAALRARADGAIRYFYPLRKKFPETGKMLRGYVKEALYVNRHGMAEEQGFLSGSNQMGYRLFLLFPDLYYLLRKKNF